MKSLTGLLRQQQQLGGLAARAYGSAVVAADGNPFLRFSNPYPSAIDHTPLLATLPETKVGARDYPLGVAAGAAAGVLCGWKLEAREGHRCPFLRMPLCWGAAQRRTRARRRADGADD